MAQISRPGQNHPNEHAERGGAGAEKYCQLAVGNQARRLRPLREVEGVGGQQIEKGFARVDIAFGEGHQTLLEFGEYVLRLARRAPPIQGFQRQGDSETHCQCDRE